MWGIAEFAIAVPVLVAATGFSYRTYSKRQDKQEGMIRKNADTCGEIKLHVATIQTDVKHINEAIQESKETQTRIFEKLDEINRGAVM